MNVLYMILLRYINHPIVWDVFRIAYIFHILIYCLTYGTFGLMNMHWSYAQDAGGSKHPLAQFYFIFV